jgi:hypothetical protein
MATTTTTRRRARTLALAGLVVALGGLVPATRPAAADCLYLVVYVSREGEAPLYPTGPGGCVQDTPWAHVVIVPSSFGWDGVPQGAPNGYFVDLRVPLPS